jgi:hypothetical protein
LFSFQSFFSNAICTATLWEMKRHKEAKAHGGNLSAAELQQIKKRKADVKKKHFRTNNKWLFAD